MKSNLLLSLGSLPDRELLAAVERSISDECRATATLIAHLGEVDARRLYAAEAYESMFDFCVSALHMAEHAAYNRIAAARVARRFPVILDMLADGSVHVTAVRLLAPHLTEENHRALLSEARHKSRREVERIIARLAPQPPVPSLVRRLPSKPPSALEWTPQSTSPVVPAAPLPAARPAVVAPLSPESYKIQCTVGEETREKLRLAQDMLRHQIPNGDVAEVLDRALTALLAELARQKFAATDSPRPAKAGTSGSRHIPAAVKRSVWLRDLGRCTFIAENGRRCAATGGLEFHHVKAYAVGGEATVENIRMACKTHNAYDALLTFGSPPYSSRDDQIRPTRAMIET